MEELAIAAKRKELWHGTAATLRTAWLESVKGGNEHVVFDEMIAQDVIAYALLFFVE
tara:strand:- start:373 stop:543 length:171 start_codon:yes stop_codon:yes gene_type:complete